MGVAEVAEWDKMVTWGWVVGWVGGMLGCGNVGVLEWWGIGMVGYWNVGVLECWGVGMLGYWNVGVLECWGVGVWEYWGVGVLGLCSVIVCVFVPLWLKKAVIGNGELKNNNSLVTTQW